MSKNMAEEYPESIKLYDHVSNSGIVHMPGRRFPAAGAGAVESYLRFLAGRHSGNPKLLVKIREEMAPLVKEQLKEGQLW